MKYAAKLNDNNEVIQVIVIFPDRDPVAEASKLGGTWVDAGEGTAPRAGRGLVHHEGEFYSRWSQIAGADTGPEEAESGYPKLFSVYHNGQVWVSLTSNNIWEPGVANWRLGGSSPLWLQPVGAEDAYSEGFIVTYNDSEWISTVSNNVWEPGVFGWEQLLPDLDGEQPQISAWVQPTGAHDAYQSGDKVTHNGSTWTSTHNANIWEPGVFGWTQE